MIPLLSDQGLCRQEEALYSHRLVEEPLYRSDLSNGIIAKIVKIASTLMTWIIFPIGIYHCCQYVWSLFLVPASFKDRNVVLRFADNWPLSSLEMRDLLFSLGLMKILARFRLTSLASRMTVGRDRSWDSSFSCRRFTVGVGLDKLDALFLRQKRIKTTDRILFYCCNEQELAEGKIHDVELLRLAHKIHAHVVVWNYPGVGLSTGRRCREGFVNGFRACLQVIEKDLQAQEIITYGRGLGASIALEGLSDHRSSIKHVLVARGLSSSLSEELTAQYGRWAGLWTRFLGWNFNHLKALCHLQIPCVLLHTALPHDSNKLFNCLFGFSNNLCVDSPSQIIPDSVIEDPEIAAAYQVLAKGIQIPVLGVREMHDESLCKNTINDLSYCVNDLILNKLNDYDKILE